jgi:hypothetical protein
MQKFRKIICSVAFISGVIFVMMGLPRKTENGIGIFVIGYLFIGLGIWFLKKKESAQRPKESAQRPKESAQRPKESAQRLKEAVQRPKEAVQAPIEDRPQQPFIKEDELIKYIRTNILDSNTCCSRKYTNMNINFDILLQWLSDYYKKHFKWPAPTTIQFDNSLSIVNKESIVVLVGDANNCVVKVHVPVDTSEAKAGLKGAASSTLGNAACDELIIGRSLGRVNSGVALRTAPREKEITVEALKQQGRCLEESIAAYIDKQIRKNQFCRVNEPIVYLRKLRDWRN